MRSQHRLIILRESRVADQDIDIVKIHHGRQADQPKFGVISDHDGGGSCRDQRLVGGGFDHIGTGAAGPLAEAVDSKENLVHVQVAQSCHRDRSHERVGGCPRPTGQDHHPVSSVGVV